MYVYIYIYIHISKFNQFNQNKHVSAIIQSDNVDKLELAQTSRCSMDRLLCGFREVHYGGAIHGS